MWDYQPIEDGITPSHVFLVCLRKEAKHERGKQAKMKCSLVIFASVSIFSFLPLVLTLSFRVRTISQIINPYQICFGHSVSSQGEQSNSNSSRELLESVFIMESLV